MISEYEIFVSILFKSMVHNIKLFKFYLDSSEHTTYPLYKYKQFYKQLINDNRFINMQINIKNDENLHILFPVNNLEKSNENSCEIFINTLYEIFNNHVEQIYSELDIKIKSKIANSNYISEKIIYPCIKKYNYVDILEKYLKSIANYKYNITFINDVTLILELQKII